MKKKFNITGTCYPDQHYMMDNRAKLADVMRMVEDGEYFIINRPRQYGKTTTLSTLNQHLNQSKEYVAFSLSFEGIGDLVFGDEKLFSQTFLRLLSKYSSLTLPNLAQWLLMRSTETESLEQMSEVLSKLIEKTQKKVVLLIDEVDKSSNNQLFLSFLGMLRNKYLERTLFPTFHSVVLAGVHDIKSLKLKVRSEDHAQYNSPWNIATDFKVDMSFHPHEIAPMLEDYAQAENVEIPVEIFADKLYYYTAGYPFLVAKLCKTLAEDILPKKTDRSWTLDDLETSVQLLLRENNTLFDSLIKNLENHSNLYDLTYSILVNGVRVPFDPHEPTISLGRLYGVFKENGTVKIHNRVYEQILYNYMVSKTFQAQLEQKHPYLPVSYAQPDGTLDIAGVLVRFQQFLREQYSKKDQNFLEREWRLVFLAFFKPILNGQGHDFKEVEISEEKRLDVVVTYHRHKYVIELKRWYGEAVHQRGLDQLADYLDRQEVDRGFLVIFEGQKEKSGRQEEIQHRGKTIFAVWV